MRRSKISHAMHDLIRSVARARDALPTDRELADQAGCSVRAVQHIMRKELAPFRAAEREAELLRNHEVSAVV